MAMNSDFVGLVAESAVAAYLIVKPGASGGCVPATAATDKAIGTADELDKAVGEVVDIAVGPRPKVRLGGAVVAGDALTANGSSKAVATTTTGNRIIGYAEVAGATDDVITYFRALGTI